MLGQGTMYTIGMYLFKKELDMAFHENLEIFYIMWFKNFSIPYSFFSHHA